jgi:hypothetical protein
MAEVEAKHKEQPNGSIGHYKIPSPGGAEAVIVENTLKRLYAQLVHWCNKGRYAKGVIAGLVLRRNEIQLLYIASSFYFSTFESV